MLKVRNLNVYYGGIHAIRGIDIDVERGEIVTIIGSNGAGKSSLLNAVSGMVRYQGEIEYEGQQLPAQPHNIVKAGICQVPEGRLIFANLTVLENLKMGAYLRNDAKEIERDLERVYALFPRLAEREKQIAGTLS
ncbi:MAG: ATP-binding cassette domain-containing protein, partial [Firmicutes bacterium]|nr:ATP-binding cassette domain-containing protein [Bacillota bacterium]